MKPHLPASWLALLGFCTFNAWTQTPASTPPPKAAFMQIVTNYTFTTNIIIVTNYVVVTNEVVVTNYYNAQGQLLQPVAIQPAAVSGLIPIPETKPQEPDPAVVKAGQLQAVRDLLSQGAKAASNQVAVVGSFTSNNVQRIQIPTGVTSVDRRKSQALITAMNLTAEKAAPEAVALLLKTAGQVKTDDPAAILKGDSGAATHLLVSAHKEELEPQLLALVRQAGAEPKLREAYSNVMLKGGGLLGSVLGTGPVVDIEAHVTQGLWRALTNQLAAQEAVIRRDASARQTPALREAFKE